jgi:hypothetical protein
VEEEGGAGEGVEEVGGGLEEGGGLLVEEGEGGGVFVFFFFRLGFGELPVDRVEEGGERGRLCIGVVAGPDLVDGVIGEERGPVVDAIVRDQSPDGHGLVGMGLGEGEGRGQAGAEVGAKDVDVSAGEVGGREVVAYPFVAEGDIVGGRWPMQGDVGTPWIAICLRGGLAVGVGNKAWPPVVDDGSWEFPKPPGRKLKLGIVAVQEGEWRDPYHQGMRRLMPRDVV